MMSINGGVKKIQTLINSFLAETNKFDDNAIIQWTKFSKR